MTKLHHVKEMGVSEFTDCGKKFINTHRAATQDGEVNCKRCKEIMASKV